MTDKAKIPPVLQFVLIIIPIVFTSFYLVYSVVGLFLDGRDKVQWAVEAWDVSSMTATIIIIYSFLVLLLVRVKDPSFSHKLAISSYIHIILALGFTVLVAILLQ